MDRRCVYHMNKIEAMRGSIPYWPVYPILSYHTRQIDKAEGICPKPHPELS